MNNSPNLLNLYSSIPSVSSFSLFGNSIRISDIRKLEAPLEKSVSSSSSSSSFVVYGITVNESRKAAIKVDMNHGTISGVWLDTGASVALQLESSVAFPNTAKSGKRGESGKAGATDSSFLEHCRKEYGGSYEYSSTNYPSFSYSNHSSSESSEL